jgi:DNA-binding NtrC family response regulator
LSKAARTLGISRTTLRAKMAALGIALDRTTVLEAVDPDVP